MRLTRSQIREAVQRLPGGAWLLHARAKTLRLLGLHRPHPPTYGGPESVAFLSKTPDDEAFITGNGVAARCRYVLNWDVLEVNEHIDNDWWFCKGDALEYFFSYEAPKSRFVLFTHNSDRSIGSEYAPTLDQRLVAWFAQNPAFEHGKLRALPIGVANPFRPNGDQVVLKRVQSDPPAKATLFDVSFRVETNQRERQHCLDQTGLELAPQRPYDVYLQDLAAAFFCISPNGNGIDCHRTWEALYLRTIPVVTRSLLTDQHADLPMLVLDDWSQFSEIEFGPELYQRVWGDWDPENIRLDRYFERVEKMIQELRREPS